MNRRHATLETSPDNQVEDFPSRHKGRGKDDWERKPAFHWSWKSLLAGAVIELISPVVSGTASLDSSAPG
jgi:hypothetical protein